MTDLCEENVPTFPQRIMALLEDEGMQQCMHWLPSGRAFRIFDPVRFEEIVLKAHFNSIKMESFVIRLGKWGFARMDQKCNSRYVSYTFASELFRRDAPELCKSMKLMNKKGRKLKPTKELRNVFDSNINVPPPSPPSSPSPPPPRPHASETTFKPMPQLHPANQVMMVFIPHPVHPVRAPPAYPPPPQQYQQWHLPHAHDQMPPLLPQYIQPPAQPLIVSYQGGANCQISPPIMHQPHHGGVPVIHQPVHQPKTQGPKAEPKITNSESFGEVATHLKADYHKKAEAAVAMMDLAFSHHQGQEVMTE